MQKVLVTQGDQYNILLKLEANGQLMSLENIKLIEFTIANNSKTYPDTVQYDGENGVFLFPVTQEETFAFEEVESLQVRIKYNDNSVVRTNIVKFNVRDSLSKTIL